VGRVLEMLAVGDSFWFKMPKPDKKQGEYRSRLYFGRHDRNVPRPRQTFSMRPQDIMDLFVCREMLLSFKIEKAKETFLETWPDYYIIHVLRLDPDSDPPVHIYSKIWIERSSLTVAIHQLYDASGEMVAEARFENYVKRSDGADAVYIPLKTRFIWPRDRVVIEVYLRRDTMVVNAPISKQVWRRPKSKDAELVEITSSTKGVQFTPITHEGYESEGKGNVPESE